MSIWVTFGADVDVPVIYCCGDHTRRPGTMLTVEGFNLGLQKDSDFEKYLRLLTAKRKRDPTGAPCSDCFRYRVTANLTGHFFAGEKWKRPDDGNVFYMGYGHLGCCSLFVIEKVSDIEYQRVDIPAGNQPIPGHSSGN